MSPVPDSILRTNNREVSSNPVMSNKGHSRPPRSTPKKWTDRLAAASNAGDSNVPRDQGQRQRQSGSNSDLDTISTPSSVLVAPSGNISLTRDLSDLSGSYMNGTTSAGPRPNSKVPGQVYSSDQSQNSYQRPWRHAKILSSSRLPQHPQPPADDDLSIGAAINRSKVAGAGPTIGVDRTSGSADSLAIEVIQAAMDPSSSPLAASLAADAASEQRRTPLLLLLMDSGRKTYELLQLWVDAESDSVRDILHATQQNLGDSWKQDYDGLFQVRNNHFSQLIHVLPAAKYDLHPYELWVCKPWSMSARATVTYASGLLNHLKRIGVLEYTRASEQKAKWKQLVHRATKSNVPSNSNDDTILTMSKQAQQRVYVPGGILKHHHACQFLSFSPPFETTGTLRVDVLSGDIDTDGESVPSQLSDSHCGYSLTGGDSEDNIVIKPSETESVVPSIAARSGSTPLPPLAPRKDSSPRRQGPPPIDKTRSDTTRETTTTATTASQSPILAAHRKKFNSPNGVAATIYEQEVTLQQHEQRIKNRVQSKPRGIARFFAALNCTKCDKALGVEVPDDENDPYKPPNPENILTKTGTPSSDTYQDSTSSSNTNKKYCIWDPNDGAMSVDGNSIVSDSAPLLFAQPEQSEWIGEF